MTAPLLVFDLDGTLVDSLPDLMATLNAMLARESLAPLPVDGGRALVGQGAKAMLKRGFESSGITLAEDRLDRLFDDFLDIYSNRLADETRPFPGVVSALDSFAARGWRFAVCTNKLEALSRNLLEALSLADRFAAICGPDTFAVRKPDPQHLIRTITAAGGQRHHTLMVGDSASDINAAKAASVPVVGVTFGYTAEPIETLGADRLIDHFDDLANAVHSLRPDLASPLA